MKLGVVVDGGWTFIPELLADWEKRYVVDVFSFRKLDLPISGGRINQWRLKLAMSKFLRQHDIVFFDWAGPLLMFASVLNTQTQIIVRLHSYELYDYAPHIDWSKVQHVILVSHAMQRRFLNIYPDMAGKTSVIYCGKSLEKFRLAQREYTGTVGMLANLIPIKRVYEVILSIHELNQQGLPFKLRLAGLPGKGADAQRYYAAMQRLVEELNLGSQVHFEGHTPTPDEFLRQIDIFVSNSFWEGQQNSLSEAMACGCYCLSHNWDGVEDVLPPEYVFITDTEFREKIIEYHGLPELEKRRHQNRLRAITEERFDIRYIAVSYQELFNRFKVTQ